MILGAILAGGQARRFGSDKALAPFNGTPMIDHVIAALRNVTDEIVVCGRADAQWRALPDKPRPGLGPLGGLNAALEFARTCGFRQVMTLPCDTPAVEPGLLARLATHSGPAFLLDCPVIGIWPSALAWDLSSWIDTSDDRSVRGWARSVAATGLAWPAPTNINHVADFENLDG